MASYSPIIINNTTPAISVIAADGGDSTTGDRGVSYSQIKQSLGSYVYDVQNIYLYSDNIKQLTGAVKYNIFDSSGNINITNITPTVDPYQAFSSLFVDTLNNNIPIIFNGNSSVSAIILPNTTVEVQFLTNRIKNSDLSEGKVVEEQPPQFVEIPEEKIDILIPKSFDGGKVIVKEKENNDSLALILIVLAAASIIALFYKKDD
jgi:hypothetical protein